MRIIRGTCDGTGSAINVCCGASPVAVLLMNMEDTARYSQLFWVDQMALISALDEGLKVHGLSDADFDRTVMAANGLSAYDGGDELFYDSADARWEDADGNDKTEVYVDGLYGRTADTDDAYRDYGDVAGSKLDGERIVTAPGFTIGADSDLNVDGEQLVWIALLPTP